MIQSFLLLLGPGILTVSFALMVAQIEPFATFFYLFAWYSLIFTFDRLIHRLEGRSLIGRCGGAFWQVLFWSTVCWFFFELLNFRLQNWHYVFVSDQPLWRRFETFLAFATVFPGIFWIEHYLKLRGVAANARGRSRRFSPTGLRGMQVLGLLSLALVLVAPRYFFPLTWLCLVCLLAPVNYRRGGDGLLAQLERGDWGPLLRQLAAGMIAGFFWEFFNFWARAKWIYTVPFFNELKLFEMPLAGFLGFPPFAVECAVLYRLLVWWHLAPPLGDYTDQKLTIPPAKIRNGILGLALVFSVVVNEYVERLTVSSTTPRVEAAEGLNTAVRAYLVANGVTYLTQLSGRGAQSRWAALEKQFPPPQSDHLRRLVALYLHQGIGTGYGNLLIHSGIESVDQLGRLSATEVLERLHSSGARTDLPSIDRVKVWIDRSPR